MGVDEIPHTRAGVQVLLLPAGEHPERNRESVLVALRERPREADKDIAQAAQACLRPHQGFQEYLRARRAVLLRENISIARHCRDGVVNDMQLVLSKNTYVELLAQYAAMLLKLSNSLGPDVLKKVLKEMKVESIYSAFSVNE